MRNPLKFKISSALKNIIGRDLITDDFIAVFELVKNSYDAHATKVDVIFKDIYSENKKIIIKDNGKGMSYRDLIDKWLFVARSSKKEGDEEDSYINFREKIKVKRAYAGAKGIGRFSCDRLGSELYLETTKDERNAKIEALVTDWSKFEQDSNNEFVNVNVLHETLEESSYGIEHGTALEISNLHSDWNRKKFERLKDSLARLINPSTIQDEDSFRINLIVEDEKNGDKKQELKNKKAFEKGKLDESEIHYFHIVNGEIKNPIFETLQLKTSYIESNVQKDRIITTLYEGGKLVYSIEEENPHKGLENIHYSIYFLNHSAKVTFARRMGVDSVEYGHIFVYKNGLRIYPYGERGEDPFKMDNRKAQGYSRYLGTREVLGYISITGENSNLRETSSRGDGFIRTTSYEKLEEQFYETLRKLEKYTIEITDWGNFLSDDDYININQSFKKNEGAENEKEFDVNENLSKLISNLTNTKKIIRFEISPDIIALLNSKSKSSAENVLKSISESIDSDNFDRDEIKKTIKNVEKKLSVLKKNKQEAEEEALEKHIENEGLRAELDQEIANRLFSESIIGREKKDLLSLQHQITHTASNISWSLDKLAELIENEAAKEKLLSRLQNISLEIQKIVSASRFVTKANFSTEASRITEDLVSFTNGYIENIYVPNDSYIHSRNQIDIKILTPKGLKKEMSFRPLEITVLLDNLFLNSRKANATKVELEWSRQDKYLLLNFRDNGNGIPEDIIKEIFEFKFSTTDGSGIGLYHTKKIIQKYKGSIKAISKKINGAEFEIRLPL